ncbi:MAG: 50S ribosomal protein L7/L12 [Patescibacteria group bacterium]
MPEETKVAKATDSSSPDASKEAFRETPSKFKTLVEGIEKLSVLELNELVKFLEVKFGVSAQAPTAFGVGAPTGSVGAVEEKDSFNVELTSVGAQKIAIIKVIKEVMGLGLKESKDLVDAAPSMLKEGMKKEEAEALKKKVEEAGGKVTLK